MQFEIFKKYDFAMRHAFSDRTGGVSSGPYSSLNLGFEIGDSEENVKENYRRFLKPTGISLNRLCTSKQVHGDKIFVVRGDFDFEETLSGYDALITAEKDFPLLVRFADCQGVLMFDPVKHVIAAVHCGWRGNVLDILGKTVLEMEIDFDCNHADLLVGISPSLGPCCAKFTDPLSELPEFMQQYVDGKSCVDLWQCSLDQLKNAGVLEKNIEIVKICTCCNKDRFFSHRRDKGVTGRMAAVIELL
ncbi:peptidoglycan editing factor PgeF [Candidatus Peregrinibacteria bacterium]|nr:peptidoglycan editing factor PgeF [Candidatus Peregrinibacteria bacterium]